MRDALIVIVGFVAGMMSGMVGVGGAVVMNPGVRTLTTLPAHTVIGSTLPPILPGSISGAIRYARDGFVDWRVAITCGVAGSFSAVAGALLSVHVNGSALLLALAAALVALTAVRTLRPAHRDEPPDDELAPAKLEQLASEPSTPEAYARPGTAPLAAVGLAAGFLSGLLGVGGGVVMLPAFTSILRLPLKIAVASSLAAVTFLAIPGTVTHTIEGNIDWAVSGLLVLGVVPGAWLGARTTIGASERKLHLIVGSTLALVAVYYAVREGIDLFS